MAFIKSIDSIMINTSHTFQCLYSSQCNYLLHHLSQLLLRQLLHLSPYFDYDSCNFTIDITLEQPLNQASSSSKTLLGIPCFSGGRLGSGFLIHY